LLVNIAKINIESLLGSINVRVYSSINVN